MGQRIAKSELCIFTAFARAMEILTADGAPPSVIKWRVEQLIRQLNGISYQTDEAGEMAWAKKIEEELAQEEQKKADEMDALVNRPTRTFDEWVAKEEAKDAKNKKAVVATSRPTRTFGEFNRAYREETLGETDTESYDYNPFPPRARAG